MFEHASSQADALDQPAFAQAGLADEDDVLLAADEVALGQRFDLQAWDGRIEVPVEGAQGQSFAEVGVLDEAFDAALAAQAGLIGEQAVQELQVRAAGCPGRRCKAASSCSAVTGIRKVAKSARICSRRLGVAVGFVGFVVWLFCGRGFIAGFLG